MATSGRLWTAEAIGESRDEPGGVGGRSGSGRGGGSVSEVPDTAPTSFVIVELATPPRQAFRFAEQADALRLAERLRRADPDAAVRTETPEEARAVLLDLAFVPEDAIGPLIIMESRHLDRETVEGHYRAVGGA
jgi:hypothetical protein